jgi:hypothetical protein
MLTVPLGKGASVERGIHVTGNDARTANIVTLSSSFLANRNILNTNTAFLFFISQSLRHKVPVHTYRLQCYVENPFLALRAFRLN